MGSNKSRKYEAVFIYQVGEDKFTSGKTEVSEELGKAGIKVLKEDDMGERTLAYSIKNQGRGHYMRYDVETEPDKIKPLDKSLKLKPEILKYVFFRKEDR